LDHLIIERIDGAIKILNYQAGAQHATVNCMSASLASVTLVANGLRWTARLLALMLASLVLLMAIGEGFNPGRLTTAELILTVPFFVVWIGLLLGWRWEGIGGILVVAGVAGFYLIHFAQTGFGRFPMGWVFPMMAAPGVLFLVCWWLRRQRRPIIDGQLILGSVSEHIKFMPTAPTDTEFVIRKAKHVVVDPGVEFGVANIARRKDASEPHFELNIEV
jgi:hypothetical protein